jgi:hypothetical protein
MYKNTKTKKEKNNMKNVKTLLIFITISAFMFASQTRVDALGGAGFWADDYANIGAFPASVNNHNVAWTDGDDFTSVWNADGTTWGFAGGSGDDMANVWWGNGNMGVNFGLGMTPAKTVADHGVVADAETAINVGFGMPLAGMDFGFTYGMGCDECGGGNVGVNLRRAQNIWLFENILVGFNMGMEEKTAGAITTASTMGFGADLYRNTTYDNGINSLFALGFAYSDAGKGTDGKDPDATMGIEWNFAVESAMTDWATLRLGYSHGYDFADGGTDYPAVTCADDALDCVAMEGSGGLVVGLGFNYGSFNLDMNVGGYDELFQNPVQYITGRNESLGANWTISYNW